MPANRKAEHPKLSIARLERDVWRIKYEALLRVVGRKMPALASWFSRNGLAMFDRAVTAFPPAEDPESTLIGMMMLYRTLTPPARLTGHGAKRSARDPLREWLADPVVLDIHFEAICKSLHRLWRPKHGFRGGLGDLMSRYLPEVYKRVQAPKSRRPRARDIAEWTRARSVDQFSYQLLAHVRGMKKGYVRKLISQQRSERQAMLQTFGRDYLPGDLSNWRSAKGRQDPFTYRRGRRRVGSPSKSA